MDNEIKKIIDDCGFEFVEVYTNKFCQECGSPYIERHSELRPRDRETHEGEDFHEAVVEKRKQMAKNGYYYGRIHQE